MYCCKQRVKRVQGMTEMETGNSLAVQCLWLGTLPWPGFNTWYPVRELRSPNPRSKAKKKEADNIRLKKGKNDSTQSFPKKREGNRRTGGWTPQSLTTKAMEVLAEEEEKKITYRIQTFFL